MRILSLDQNAVSNLVKNGHEPFWRDLRELLLSGVKSAKLLCPIPKETIAETAPCPREVRVMIRDFQHALSLGFSFKSFGVIEGEETLALVRPGFQSCAYEQIVWHSVEDDSLASAATEEIHDVKSLMCRRMDPFVPTPDRLKLTVKELRSQVIASRAGSLYRQSERVIAGQPLDSTDDLQFELCQFLVSHGTTKAEVKQLADKILTHEWEAIPLVWFHATLGALLDYDRLRGMRYDLNDEIDLCRVAIALHTSAMMITDGKMAEFVRRLEREVDHKFDVFGIKEQDAIMTALRSVIASTEEPPSDS
jgi:hypothetical protein